MNSYLNMFYQVGLFTTALLATLSIQTAAATSSYSTFTVTSNGPISRVVFNHPPINLYDTAMINDLYSFLKSLSVPPAPKVVIFSSADPDFYIAHLDVNLLVASSPSGLSPSQNELLSLYGETVQLLANSSTIFIGEVNGRGTGAGNELLVQMDMRFAGPNMRLGAFEVALGLTHGNGGLQHVTDLINEGRASEYLLSASSIGPQEAAHIGWVNRAFDNETGLKNYVDELAQRIALFPAGALAATKAGIRENRPPSQNIVDDLTRFASLAGTEEAQQLVKKFLVLSKNQTRSAFELGLNGDLTQLYQ